ncbi:MAG: MFS transporter, partial [Amphritea sp.]|nr:MFS transporter [Amphritea sp.]
MPTSSAAQVKTPILLLAGMAIASPVALNLYAPVMPVLAEQFDTSPFTIQLGFTFYLLTLAIGQLISGPLADRYGRRPVFFWGFLLHILGALLGAFAVEVWQLLLARILQAAGGCTGMLLARSIILDQHGKDKAAGMLGYITMGIASAQALAPTMGGYLNLAVGWQSVFWVSMALGTVVWLGALFTLPETSTAKSNTGSLLQSFTRYGTVLSSRNYVFCALSATMIASGFFVFMTSAPFLVSEFLQGNSADYGNWFLLVAGGFWFGSLTAGKISATVGTRRMMLAGNSLSGMGALLMLGLFLLTPFSFMALFMPMALYT